MINLVFIKYFFKNSYGGDIYTIHTVYFKRKGTSNNKLKISEQKTTGTSIVKMNHMHHEK